MKKKRILSEDEVKHISHLARLLLSEAEVKKFQKQLINIFDYISQIGSMKTKKVVGTSHTSGSTNIFKEDVIDNSKMLTQEESLSNASGKKDGHFRIKAIFEEQ